MCCLFYYTNECFLEFVFCPFKVAESTHKFVRGSSHMIIYIEPSFEEVLYDFKLSNEGRATTRREYLYYFFFSASSLSLYLSFSRSLQKLVSSNVNMTYSIFRIMDISLLWFFPSNLKDFSREPGCYSLSTCCYIFC